MKVLTQPANDNLSRDIRRYQVRLKVTATGVLIFAFWGLIRNMLVTFLNADDQGEYQNWFREVIGTLSAGEMTALILDTLLVVIGVVLFDCMFRIMIFVLARRESVNPNARRTNSYIIMTSILILGSLWSIYGIASQTAKGDYALDDCVISILIELTSLVTMGELIDAAHKLRKLRDKAAAHSSAGAADQNPSGPASAAPAAAPAPESAGADHTDQNPSSPAPESVKEAQHE